MGDLGYAVDGAKGKGKAKGGPPAPKGKAAPPKPSTKAVGGFAPNMQKKAKPMIFVGMQCISVQEPDGHFEAGRVAEQLRQTALSSENDFDSRLLELGHAGPTGFVLRIFQTIRSELGQEFSGVEIQTVGTGRGDSTTFKEHTEPMTEELHNERETNINAHFVKRYEPACGMEWSQCAERWLAGQELLVDMDTRLDALVGEWFAGFVKGSRGRRLSEGALKAKEEEQRRRDEAAKREEAQREAHWKGMSSRSVDGVPWEDVRTMLWCSGGMGGAILVQIGESEAVVLKPQGMNAVAEAVAAQVASLIEVRVARVRVLSMLQDEFFNMSAALHKSPAMVAEHKQRAEFITSGTKEFVAVVEFVQGCVLQGLEGQKALGGDDVLANLTGIGSLVALDCLLNNVDRVPAIWKNDGNLSNVMIAAGNFVIGIDQQVNAISDPAGRERYLESLREFCCDARFGRVESTSVARVRTAVADNCGVELSSQQCQCFLDGARGTFERIARLQLKSSDDFKRIEGKMIADFGHASVDVGLSRLEFMLEFIGVCSDVVSEVYA